MNCADIMRIPEFRGVMTLKAGEEGLQRQVRWIYFADCLQCIQNEYKMEKYIHGGEFVVLTNRSVTDDNQKMIALVEEMASYHIVALGINEGQISQELLAYCQSINLPLFELSQEYPLIDLSQILCQRLVMEENSRNAEEQLFSSILDGEHLNRESVYTQARYLNIDLSGVFRVVEFLYDRKDKKAAGAFGDGDSLTVGQAIKRVVRERFSYNLSEDILTRLQTGSVLALVPSNQINEDELKKILLSIRDLVGLECGRDLIIGVGNSAAYLEDVRLSRNEAAAAIRAADLELKEEAIYFFKDQGLYSFISRVEDEKFLDDFVENHLGRLVRADEAKGGDLCETLEAYLDNNCSVKETAEAMYIHRNTLNYRLGRIREILGVDLGNLKSCLNLKLAFLVRNYRNMYTVHK